MGLAALPSQDAFITTHKITMSKPKLYPKTLKLGITKPQSAWITRKATDRSQAQVVRDLVDAARKRRKVAV